MLRSYLFSYSDCLFILKKLVTPNEVYESITDINLESLLKFGYNTVFLDVDNTLVTYHERQVNLQVTAWVNQVKSLGYHVYILSNNISKQRISHITNQLGVKGIYFACKPFTYSIRDFARHHKINFKKSIFIGDQLLKDVIIANWLHAYSILVDPLDKKLSFFKTGQRNFELYLLDKM